MARRAQPFTTGLGARLIPMVVLEYAESHEERKRREEGESLESIIETGGLGTQVPVAGSRD